MSGSEVVKTMANIKLERLAQDDREQFILDNQEAFNYGALEEFGERDLHFEEEGQIISRQTIEAAIDVSDAYRIVHGGEKIGGAVVKTSGARGELELLFVSPKFHSKGAGQSAWAEIEKLYPHVKIWQTVTPYFEKRNIHFYVNRCGFRIVEFFNSHHTERECDSGSHDDFFRFEKVLE